MATITSIPQPLPRPVHQQVYPGGGIFASALLGFIAAYYALAPHWKGSRQRAWVLTALASAAMTLGSLPYIGDYAGSGGDVNAVTARSGGVGIVRVFQAYLFADMLMGAVHYRDQVNLLSGWVHHSVYVLVAEYVIRNAWAHIFCFCAFMELPTLLLSLATLFPALRNDVLFAGTFFSTRIALHTALLISYTRAPARVVVLGGSWGPACVLAGALMLHGVWFVGCLRGIVRRSNKQGRAVKRAEVRVEAAAVSGGQRTPAVVDEPARQASECQCVPENEPAALPTLRSLERWEAPPMKPEALRPATFPRRRHIRRASFEHAMALLRAARFAELGVRLPDRRTVYSFVGLPGRDAGTEENGVGGLGIEVPVGQQSVVC